MSAFRGEGNIRRHGFSAVDIFLENLDSGLSLIEYEFHDTEQLIFMQECNTTTVRIAFQNVELFLLILASSCKHRDNLNLTDINAAHRTR